MTDIGMLSIAGPSEQDGQHQRKPAKTSPLDRVIHSGIPFLSCGERSYVATGLQEGNGPIGFRAATLFGASHLSVYPPFSIDI